MKKVFLSAALLLGISFVGNATVAKSAKTTSISHKIVNKKKTEMYCQGVQFTCAFVWVCGESFEDYVDCLNEAKAIFD